MKGQRVLFSSSHDDWDTPKELFSYLNSIFSFELDPCPSTSDLTKHQISTPHSIPVHLDGLKQSWGNYSTFVNPPYSQVAKWIDKAMDEYDYRSKNYSYINPIVLLVAARTDTQWFHKILNCYDCDAEVIFIKGRLKFSGTKVHAPFPSCIIILGGKGVPNYRTSSSPLAADYDIKPISSAHTMQLVKREGK